MIDASKMNDGERKNGIRIFLFGNASDPVHVPAQYLPAHQGKIDRDCRVPACQGLRGDSPLLGQRDPARKAGDKRDHQARMRMKQASAIPERREDHDDIPIH
ncbi:hypothetical protein [Massilia haematophila]|uniref:Uncharacterized protein n=1 Tax=Massilia haematophila TaxID=457923 RepID=A0ABV7PR82_9BURK